MAGYSVAAGLDIETNFIASFKHNFPNAVAVTESIVTLKPEDFARRCGLEGREIDILVGGPPCQGFSKNVPRKYRYLEDPKNQLVRSFLGYAEHFQPKIILMENVAEMRKGFDGQYTTEVTERLAAAGYTVSHCVLNAADYGVPQRRRRAFFMANRVGLQFAVPRATHFPPRDAPLLMDRAHVSVWDAIGDLPPLLHGEGREVIAYATGPQSEFQRTVRNASGSVKNHVSRHLQPTQLARLAALKPGQGHKDLPAELQVKSGYSGAYGRLTKEMIAPTITRWVFHPGSGRWGHPVDIRVLSIREVARIQGFPDSFEFVGSYLQQAGQLGNAVPPILAQRVVEGLTRQLQHHNASKSSNSRSIETFSDSEGKRKLIA